MVFKEGSIKRRGLGINSGSIFILGVRKKKWIYYKRSRKELKIWVRRVFF